MFTTNIASYRVPVFAARAMITGDSVGYWDAETQEIGVLMPAGPAGEADRMLHEHIHAISTICLPPDQQLSENQVNTLALALMDTLIMNPDLESYISSRVRDAREDRPRPARGGRRGSAAASQSSGPATGTPP